MELDLLWGQARLSLSACLFCRMRSEDVATVTWLAPQCPWGQLGVPRSPFTHRALPGPSRVEETRPLASPRPALQSTACPLPVCPGLALHPGPHGPPAVLSPASRPPPPSASWRCSWPGSAQSRKLTHSLWPHSLLASAWVHQDPE